MMGVDRDPREIDGFRENLGNGAVSAARCVSAGPENGNDKIVRPLSAVLVVDPRQKCWLHRPATRDRRVLVLVT